jgi:hypothetical protein
LIRYVSRPSNSSKPLVLCALVREKIQNKNQEMPQHFAQTITHLLLPAFASVDGMSLLCVFSLPSEKKTVMYLLFCTAALGFRS